MEYTVVGVYWRYINRDKLFVEALHTHKYKPADPFSIKIDTPEDHRRHHDTRTTHAYKYIYINSRTILRPVFNVDYYCATIYIYILL